MTNYAKSKYKCLKCNSHNVYYVANLDNAPILQCQRCGKEYDMDFFDKLSMPEKGIALEKDPKKRDIE